MNNIIKRIVISGFRSIEQQSIKCNEVNVFCGANDSGKSNVLRAMNLFFNAQTDFYSNLKFTDDYNKVAFAKAVRATKMKQQIKIRVYINIPTSYTSLKGEKEIFIERAYDRNGLMTEKYSNEKKRAIISRLFNKIKYIYIPALKGKDVLQYIMGLIGGYELIDQSDISLLNGKISDKTKDLNEILTSSNIKIDTSFGLPVLLSDFWEKLSVDTIFEKTDYISDNVSGTGENRPLNKNLFKIPLTSRGEGVKSKYIPPLLEWLNKNKPENIYVWGIDEPENSLEFSLCEELSSLYYNDYSKKVQCFLTTHSLAFINPKEDTKQKPQIFRCLKDEFGSTKIRLLNDLFKEQDKIELFDELGALNVQRELIEQFREDKKRREELKQSISQLEEKLNKIIGTYKCIILTEDSDIEPLKSLLKASGFQIQETDIRTYKGCTNVVAAQLLNNFIKEKFPDLKFLIHIDRDYLTDDEIKERRKKFHDIGISVFITDGTDIESHFFNSKHINFLHPDISIEKAQQLIDAAASRHLDEAIKLLRTKNFGDKHKEKYSHADNFLNDLPRLYPLKYVKGKSMFGTLKQLIKDNNEKKENARIHEESEFIKNEFLNEFAAEIWKNKL